MKRARMLIAMLLAAVSLTACNLLDSYGREHHFKKGESSALILDAKQRVITQRDIRRDEQVSDRIAPDVIICSEPSPDVANALSTAISASLSAGIPSAKGAKNFSADLSRSASESLMQLGSRIATIQLLRDELADLCRSYANGAVTTTTYTLRLSRLDKKMVTLLLSEAAGRPAGAQSVVLGDATVNTKPAASAEEISKARQAVVDASADVVTKEKAFKEASEATFHEKQAERDAALQVLQDKQAALLSMERRLLETSTGADVQTVLVNSSPGTNNPGETLQSLQENFLLQDDLTTFLDACISSLDRQLPQMTDAQKTALDAARDKLQEIEGNRARAMSDYYQTKYLLEQGTVAEKSAAQAKLADIEAYLSNNEVDSNFARKKFEDTLGRLQPVSRFGEYCQTTALGQLLRANTERIEARVELVQERRRLAETQTRSFTLRACELLLANPASADAASRQACNNALVQYAKEMTDSERPKPIMHTSEVAASTRSR